jgi:hypothetical protein
MRMIYLEKVGGNMSIEFIECPSLSISYDATGKASVSLTVIRDDMDDLSGTYTNESWGGVEFTVGIMGATQQAIIGSGGWAQWSLQLEGVGE